MTSNGVLSILVGLAVALAAPAQATPTTCHKQIVNQLFKYKKKYLKLHIKCVDRQNLAKLAGPCPDADTLLKIQDIRDKVTAKLGVSCTMADLATLGFGSTCEFDTTPTGIEAQCAALPVTTGAEFGACLACWKGAELSEYLATLYASHAVELCGGSFDATSPTCSPLDCTTPLPDQRDLGDTGEFTCQRIIARAGFKHLVKVERLLEKCGLAGGTRESCLADLTLQAKMTRLDGKLETKIKNKCGNRSPVASPSFCCRTGMGNECTAAATREDCVDGGGEVQDNKICDIDDTCASVGGAKGITWWETCPQSDSCPGTPLATLDDLIACLDSTVDEMTDELLCLQFPTGWPCPSSPSGAFVN